MVGGGAVGHGLVGGSGFLSGVLNGATAMSGPPVVLVLLGSAAPPEEVRGVLIYFIVFSAAIGVAATLIGGLQSWDTLLLAGLMAPGVLGGALAGAALFRRLPSAHYWTISMAGLLVIAVVSLTIALGSL